MNSDITTAAADILFINNLRDEPAGGKARGLQKLTDCGARVPAGFVVLNPAAEDLAERITPYLESLGHGLKAVRSSAIDEDGAEASFAGQYETFLNCKNSGEVIDAVTRCAAAANSQRVDSYLSGIVQKERSSIAVIVQNMVDAAYAGVIFTADPVTGRRDRTVICAVEGLGEKLVSGLADGSRYVFSRSGKPVSATVSSGAEGLPENITSQLIGEAGALTRKFGYPLDLEWAVDRDGTLFWLQARPITSLPRVHLNELDSSVVDPRHIFTRCNIGEMMPGPVTPLTWSVFGRGIEYGLQEFLVKLGVQERIIEENRFIFMFYNHLFMSLTNIYEVPDNVLLTRREDVEYSILGFSLPHKNDEVHSQTNVIIRLRNLIKYIRYIYGAKKSLDRLRAMQKDFRVEYSQDPLQFYERISAAKQTINEAWSLHYVTSSKSGSLNSAMLQILTRGNLKHGNEFLGDISSILAGVGNVDGFEAVRMIEQLADTIVADQAAARRLMSDEANEVAAWLRGPDAGSAGRLFQDLMRDHGHRCVREAELRENDWASEPATIVEVLRLRLTCALTPGHARADVKENIRRLVRKSGLAGGIFIRLIIPAARTAVANRENSKSLCIKMQRVIKHAYRNLGMLLAEKKLLDDDDLIFFLTHEEIGSLVRNTDASLNQTAAARRALFPSCAGLSFNDTSCGVPEPVEPDVLAASLSEGCLRGVPVSAGQVTGKARVVGTIDDAGGILPGEIMVAAYTDVGWTPYFSIIAGLVTEIGSVLSHGAVVAREYGIPAIVSVKSARSVIRTGDIISIDGTTGEVVLQNRGFAQG